MKIAFLGDSITLGYGLTDRSYRFSTLTAQDLSAEEINFGITGTLMARAGLSRTNQTAFLDRLDGLADADLAVIFGGTNDYFWSDRPIQPPAGQSGSDYFECALDELCRRVCAMRADRPTLLLTPYPHNGIGNFAGGSHWREDSSRHDTDCPNYNGHTLRDYVDCILTTGKRYSLPVLDLYEAMAFDHTVHTLDGCHPNEAGHRLLADTVVRAIRTLPELAL